MILQHNISGTVFKDMLITGAAVLERNKKLIDSLNVFPVPDGDTGTNMSMTMNSAVRELKTMENMNVSAVASAVARGALRGARGNSGVILSQIFRGIARSFEGVDSFDAQMLTNALKQGSEEAYKAVMRPKEGTILTVVRVVADCAKAHCAAGDNVYKLIDSMIVDGERILAKTPDMLPVLKEAGVVDSGGKGFMMLLRGFKMALDGDYIEDYEAQADTIAAQEEREENIMIDSLEDITFAYCTEFFIEHLDKNFVDADTESLREHLQRIGDSVVVVADQEMVKVHVHTNVPGKALQMALRLGELNGVKIENMLEQHRRLIEERKSAEKEYGMVAVSVGEGIDTVLKDLGVDAVVTGGQTMNPSALDIERAIKRVNARRVFVFPNNKNIILAAQQAAELIGKSLQIRAIVVPTQSIMQGISAILAFDAGVDEDNNLKTMESAAQSIKSGSVTYAIRSTGVNGRKIEEGDLIGMVDGEIVQSGKDINAVLDGLVKNMMRDDGEYITIFYGADVAKEDAEVFASRVSQTYSNADIVLQYGGQPLYYYLISVE